MVCSERAIGGPSLLSLPAMVQQLRQSARSHDQRPCAQPAGAVPRLSQGVQKQVVSAQTLCQLAQCARQAPTAKHAHVSHLMLDAASFCF